MRHPAAVLACVFLACGGASAEEIAPGVTYTVYHVAGPNVVHVVAADRLFSEYKLEVGFAQKKRNFTARQGTSTIAGLYHSPPAREVLAAINGSYFGTAPDIVGSPVASAGEIVQRPEADAYDTFIFGPARRAVVEESIGDMTGTLVFANGVTTTLHQYNTPFAVNKLTVFTPQWDTSTRSNLQCVEVIVDDVTYPMRSAKEISGVVTAIRTGVQSINNPIPAGGLVLNAYGIPQNIVLANTAVGDRLRMRFNTSSEAMNNADFAITGAGWILHNGLKQNGTGGQPNNWALRSAQVPGSTPYVRNPRTVLAASQTHVFLVVCDGRSSQSVGMTFDEMADFLTGTLGALEAINLDGGGSSTMVVNGTIRNTPSDGSERAVANAVLLVRQPTPTAFPVIDPFSAAGRLAGWDDKFGFCGAIPFEPAAPGGDGWVLRVLDPVGGTNSVRRGDHADADYSVEADIYCEYRPELAADGFERYVLFARDSGTGALGLSTYGGGNCYALAYDSHTGRVQAGRYMNGSFIDFGTPVLEGIPSGWHRFRIDCSGSTITYWINNGRVLTVNDTALDRGYFGIGYESFYATAANRHGTRADHFRAGVDSPAQPGDMDFDGDVDMSDFGRFQLCLSGTEPQTRLSCNGARLDADGDVDDADLNLFVGCISGSNVMADPGCVF